MEKEYNSQPVLRIFEEADKKVWVCSYEEIKIMRLSKAGIGT